MRDTSSYVRRFLLVAAVAGCLSPHVLTGQQTTTAVMAGLDNPRGLAIGPEGALYVVEAGRGGAGPCLIIGGVSRCFGATGALTRLWNGRTERVLTGLPSFITAAGEVTGPHDVVFPYRGGAYLSVGLGNAADPVATRAGFGAAAGQLGMLMWVSASWSTRAIADVAAYEFSTNPVGAPDSNPFGLLADGRSVVVADAGANALMSVDSNGRISTLATFPSRPARATDAVPTSVVLGPDGAYYVGELTGVPFAAGAARVYRVVQGSPPEVFAEGFKTVIDLAFGPDGALYVLEHASGAAFFAGPGNVVRLARDRTRTVVLQGLDRPTALVVDGRGMLYVTNHGVSAGIGEVLRVELPR